VPAGTASWQVPASENGGGAACCVNFQITGNARVPSWQQVADEPLPELGQLVVQKAHLLIQPLGETMTGLLLKYQHQDWMLKDQH
jgi:hypothetical protein